MPAARGVKRTASKSSSSAASTAPKSKKKRNGEYYNKCFIALVFFTFLFDVIDLSNYDGGKRFMHFLTMLVWSYFPVISFNITHRTVFKSILLPLIC